MTASLLKLWLAAGAVVAASAVSAGAADLNYRTAPPDRWGSAYEDPRYADLYGSRPPPPPAYEEPRRYGYPYRYGQPPIPREPVYRDDPYERPVYPRYAEGHPPAQSYSVRPGNCAPKDEVRFELQRQGWRDLHDVQILDRGTAAVRARRTDGRLFELKIDRCTGEVVTARPLEARPGPYADGYAPERRWQRWN